MSYFLVSAAIMSAAVLLFFCAGVLIGAATISGAAPWARALLVVGGVVVAVPMCSLGWVSSRRIRVALHWRIHGGPLKSRRPGSRNGREAHRLINSAFPVPQSPFRIRFARLALIPSSPPWLVRGYALAAVAPVSLAALMVGYIVYAAIHSAVSGGHAGLVPLWVLIPLQVVALVGAVIVIVQMPRPVPAGSRLRLRGYAFVCVAALVAVLLERDSDRNAVVAIVAAASLIVLVAADAAVATAGRSGHRRNG